MKSTARRAAPPSWAGSSSPGRPRPHASPRPPCAVMASTGGRSARASPRRLRHRRGVGPAPGSASLNAAGYRARGVDTSPDARPPRPAGPESTGSRASHHPRARRVHRRRHLVGASSSTTKPGPTPLQGSRGRPAADLRLRPHRHLQAPLARHGADRRPQATPARWNNSTSSSPGRSPTWWPADFDIDLEPCGSATSLLARRSCCALSFQFGPASRP